MPGQISKRGKQRPIIYSNISISRFLVRIHKMVKISTRPGKNSIHSKFRKHSLQKIRRTVIIIVKREDNLGLYQRAFHLVKPFKIQRGNRPIKLPSHKNKFFCRIKIDPRP